MVCCWLLISMLPKYLLHNSKYVTPCPNMFSNFSKAAPMFVYTILCAVAFTSGGDKSFVNGLLKAKRPWRACPRPVSTTAKTSASACAEYHPSLPTATSQTLPTADSQNFMNSSCTNIIIARFYRGRSK